jgi:hypothetical protein
MMSCGPGGTAARVVGPGPRETGCVLAMIVVTLFHVKLGKN